MHTQPAQLVGFLKDSFELEVPETIQEADLLLKLERRLGYLLERNAEEFFQLLYRIDVAEHKMRQVLQLPDALAQLALLVYHRQLEKIKSREAFKSPVNNNPADKDLQW